MDSHVTKSVLRLAPTQPSNRHPRRIPPRHLLTARLPHLEIQPSLDDAEQILRLRVPVSGDAAVEPADRALHGFPHTLLVWGRGGNDIVELHDDVAADGILQRD